MSPLMLEVLFLGYFMVLISMLLGNSACADNLTCKVSTCK